MEIKEITLALNGITPEQLEPEAQENRYKEIFDELISSDSQIAVICDSDADGMCSARIWREYFVGSNYTIYPLDRATRNVLEIAVNLSEKIVVCLDCGSSERWEDIPNKSFYVIDHHETHHKVDGVKYINPTMDFGSTTFCTSSLLYALFENVYGGNRVAIQYAAIGGVADMVPMLSDNRHVVRRGLKVMNKYPCDIALEFPPYNSPYDETHIGFSIAPAINAPSRIGDNVTAIDAVIYGKQSAISALKGANNKRRALVKKSLEKAKIDEKPNCVIVEIDNQGMSISGLIANKVLASSGKPVLCINNGSVSFRSRTADVDGFIKSLPDELLAGGGHKSAAGGVIDVKEVDVVKSMFEEYCNTHHVNQDVQLYDIFTEGDDIYQLHDEWAKLKPYGQKFKAPIFGAYLTVMKIGKDVKTKSVSSGYAIIKMKSKKRTYTAISYDVPALIEVGKEYFVLFEMMEGFILIKGIEDE